VLEAFRRELGDAGIEASVRENCAAHQVGCRGLCARDVLVDVAVGDERTTYQYIKADMVPRIVQEHVLGNQPVAEWQVGEEYAKFNEKQVKVVLADCGRIDPEDIEAYRRRLPHGAQVGARPEGHGRHQVHHLQRRRGRPGRVHGPRGRRRQSPLGH
jgi:NADH-quinone oxidoreductase subunit F